MVSLPYGKPAATPRARRLARMVAIWPVRGMPFAALDGPQPRRVCRRPRLQPVHRQHGHDPAAVGTSDQYAELDFTAGSVQTPRRSRWLRRVFVDRQSKRLLLLNGDVP
jgi:hypothetical protein